jgi:hypothetical protein
MGRMGTTRPVGERLIALAPRLAARFERRLRARHSVGIVPVENTLELVQDLQGIATAESRATLRPVATLRESAAQIVAIELAHTARSVLWHLERECSAALERARTADLDDAAAADALRDAEELAWEAA